MKAITIEKFGGTDVLKQATLSKPTPKEQELLIAVKACGLNPADYKIRNGDLAEVFPISFPHILGGDVSGVVEKTGSGVDRFAEGDEVFFSAPLDKDGGYAEYMLIDQQYVASKPKTITHTQAASLPVVGLTAIQALRDFSGIKKGDKVLIHAGAGGVGSFAVQYAAARGAEVYTTARAHKHEYVKSLGAHHAIDYTQEDFVAIAQAAGGMDIVFETVGHESYLKSIMATKEGGSVPCIVHPPEDDVIKLAASRNIKTDFMLLQGIPADLDEIAQLVDQKLVEPQVAKTFNMDEIAAAHEALESGRTQGKLVLEVAASR